MFSFSVPKQPKTAWSSRNPELSTLETVYFGDRPISGVCVLLMCLINFNAFGLYCGHFECTFVLIKSISIKIFHDNIM